MFHVAESGGGGGGAFNAARSNIWLQLPTVNEVGALL